MKNFPTVKQHRILLIPLLILVCMLMLFKVNAFIIVMIALGHVWSWGIYDERIYKKVDEASKYRFSFLKLYSKYGELVFNKVETTNTLSTAVLRATTAGSLAFTLYLLTKQTEVFSIFIGSFFFESTRISFFKS